MALLDDFVWGRGAHRRRDPRDPPDQGARRARAHPTDRRSEVPPQARTRLSLGRRIHRTAAAAAARRAGACDDHRARPLARAWGPRAGGSCDAHRGVPILRAHSEPVVPDEWRPERRAPAAARAHASARAGARHDADRPARGLPASDPPQPGRDGAPLLRARLAAALVREQGARQHLIGDPGLGEERELVRLRQGVGDLGDRGRIGDRTALAD